jgi:hypothetical protein
MNHFSRMKVEKVVDVYAKKKQHDNVWTIFTYKEL